MSLKMLSARTLVEVVRGTGEDRVQVDLQRVGGQRERLVLAAEGERKRHSLTARHQTGQRHGARHATVGHLNKYLISN